MSLTTYLNPKSIQSANDIAIKVVKSGNSNIEIEPNIYYKISNVSSLSVTFKSISSTYNDVLQNYMFEVSFVGGNELILPDNIKWANGVTPEICKDGMTYQISVINKLGIITEFNEI